MAKVKYRKCPECGGKMVVRKSGKGNKFWGCTMWKENDCKGSAEYHGSGARAGMNVSIREIDNGYIITTSNPYAGIDDDPIEQFVKTQEELPEMLTSIFTVTTPSLCKQIEENTEFTDEIDPVKHEKRVEVVKRGTTNVQDLLDKMKKARAKAEAGETVD